MWYDHLVASSLGKHSMGPTPLSVVHTRDLHTRGQQHQEGTRDKLITNLVVKTPRLPPIMVGMMDNNTDDLNQLNRKGLPDLADAALQGVKQAYNDAARPTADLVVPTASEHTMGQLLQMLMLATAVEGRLMGINPYGEPGAEMYRKPMWATLKTPSGPQ
jgi:glucose-6-phosphate isomerase